MKETVIPQLREFSDPYVAVTEAQLQKLPQLASLVNFCQHTLLAEPAGLQGVSYQHTHEPTGLYYVIGTARERLNEKLHPILRLAVVFDWPTGMTDPISKSILLGNRISTPYGNGQSIEVTTLPKEFWNTFYATDYGCNSMTGYGSFVRRAIEGNESYVLFDIALAHFSYQEKVSRLNNEISYRDAARELLNYSNLDSMPRHLKERFDALIDIAYLSLMGQNIREEDIKTKVFATLKGFVKSSSSEIPDLQGKLDALLQTGRQPLIPTDL